MKSRNKIHRTWQRNLLMLLSLAAAVAFSSAGPIVRADSIAVDFGDSQVTAMDSSETAGVIPQAYWNGSGTGTSGTVTGLVDDQGAGTGASVAWACNNTWRTPITEAAGDARMMRGYADTNSTSTTTVTVSDIPYGSYDLIVYLDGDNGTDNRVGRYRIVNPADSSVVAGPVFALDPANTNFGGTYTRIPVSSTSDQGTNTSSGNYIIFEALTLGAFTLEATPGSTGTTKRASVNGIQILGKSYPRKAGNPDPADDPDLTGDEVPTNKTMSWTTAEDPNDGNYGAGPDPAIVGHYVYLTTDKAALEAIPAGDTSDSSVYRTYNTVGSETYTPGVYNADTNPGGLNTDKVYYWRIDERSEYGAGEDPNYWVGDIWTFQTTKLLPVFDPDGQPDDIVVFPGESAALSVSVTSATQAHYAWKMVNFDGEDPNVGTDSATLSFDPAQAADDGQYYCVITNDAGPVTSDSAWLVVKRLVGRWELNNNLNDSKEGRNGAMYFADGTSSTDPNFSDDGIEDLIGQDGQSFRFYGNGKHIRIADTAEDYNFYRVSGLTASAWVKTTQTNWGAPVAKQDREGTLVGWILNVNNASGVMTIRQAHNDIEGDSAVNDGEWHLVTGTYDPATGRADVYIDGEQEEGWVNTAALSVQTEPLVFGAEAANGDWPYTGLVDDVRVYNYPLNAYEIALLYTSIRQLEVICPEPVTIDYNGDCTQDLQDFAVFARTWLNCNNVPTCWNTPEHPLD